MDGFIYIEFNQELIVPPFTAWPPKAEEKAYEWQNQGYETEEDWAKDNFMGFLNAE